MSAINPTLINLFAIPFSFLLVVLSIFAIQSITINVVSRRLGNISFNHPYLFRAMNWWGVFIHELSHAITALLTLNKVKEFKVSSSGGHVVHYSNRSFGFVPWLATQLISASPAFVPPLIVAVLLGYLHYINLQNITFDFGSLEPIGVISSLYLGLIPYIVKTIGLLLVNLNYSRVENILLLLVLTFSFSAAKPSSIDKSKSGIQGDLQSLIEGFIKFPLYTLLSVLVFTALFWILLKFNLTLFLYVVMFLILLPILSIFALVCNYLFIKLINLFDSSSKLRIVLSILAFVLVYFFMKQYTVEQYLINIISACVLIGILKLAK
ncbi:MAG: M50 family metallopeptidase [Candidatus Methanoperedens sp.]|nr:M50 family metallopeptidase [Candidatus Methanoperedens sp.]